MPPVPCGFRATIADGGSTPGMNIHGELTVGHGYLHAKTDPAARRLPAPMKSPGPCLRVPDLLGPPDLPIFEKHCGVAARRHHGS